jgi:hypothetical protein
MLQVRNLGYWMNPTLLFPLQITSNPHKVKHLRRINGMVGLILIVFHPPRHPELLTAEKIVDRRRPILLGLLKEQNP